MYPDLKPLEGKTLLVTGGTGMIGKWMIDHLLKAVDCRIIVTGRSEEKFRERFPVAGATFVKWDIAHEHIPAIEGPVDFIIHLASNTHPVAYATDPVATIAMNVTAAKELLDLGVKKKVARFVYASSVEVYGQNRGDVEKFAEDYCGYLDCNTLRAGYPESKRCGEALCQAYAKQYGLDVVIPRIARVYGPTLLKTDTKALSQFIADALAGRDIVLKSEGRQYYSYLHVDDAASGILFTMINGVRGEAYNLADERSDIRLRDLAELVAKTGGVKVVFDLPGATESAGFSTATLARLDPGKIAALGWKADYGIEDGIRMTLRELAERGRRGTAN